MAIKKQIEDTRYLQCKKCGRKTSYMRGWAFLPNNTCKGKAPEDYQGKKQHWFMQEHIWEEKGEIK